MMAEIRGMRVLDDEQTNSSIDFIRSWDEELSQRLYSAEEGEEAVIRRGLREINASINTYKSNYSLSLSEKEAIFGDRVHTSLEQVLILSLLLSLLYWYTSTNTEY
jgi:hypothetical protein